MKLRRLMSLQKQSDWGALWQRGATGALIATITPTLILAAVVVHDIGSIMAARRWGQSVVDSAVTQASLQIDADAFNTDLNEVKIADTAAGAALRWVTSRNEGGGGAPINGQPRVPQLSCGPVTVNDSALTVDMTCNVTAPVLFPRMYELLGFTTVPGQGTVLLPVSAQSTFMFGIETRLTR